MTKYTVEILLNQQLEIIEVEAEDLEDCIKQVHGKYGISTYIGIIREVPETVIEETVEDTVTPTEEEAAKEA